MDRREILAVVGIAALAGFGGCRQRERGGANADPTLRTPVTSTPPGVREQFAGLYKLVAYAPHGDHPNGRVFYDKAGHMFGMLHPSGRKPLPPENPTLPDYRDAYRGLVSYYGTYDVDPPTGRVVHHVEGASNPAWIGTDFFRWYEFKGNQLTLRTSPDSPNPVVWERMAG